MNKLEKINETIFENIRHVDDEGNEYWYARELQKVLTYKDWRYFDLVIQKSIVSCKNSLINEYDHFVVYNKMVKIGSGAKRYQKDYMLSRYACYLISQNANPKYETAALGQTYFAIQTRKVELTLIL